jgi:hypothetical protein
VRAGFGFTMPTRDTIPELTRTTDLEQIVQHGIGQLAHLSQALLRERERLTGLASELERGAKP